jgi:hypothetical protein
VIPPQAFLGPATHAFKGLRWARGVYRDDGEMSKLLNESCLSAVAAAAGLEERDDAVQRVVQALAEALDRVPFPEPKPNLLERAVAKMPRARGIRRRPRQRLVHEPDPVDLLEEWIGLGLATERVEAELAALGSRPPVGAEAVAGQFRKGFELALVNGYRSSKFRSELIAGLARRESEVDFVQRLRARTAAVVGTAAAAGAIGGEVLDLTQFSTPGSALLGVAVAAASAGAFSAVVRARKRWTAASVVKEASLGFVGEVLDSKQPLPPLPDALISAIVASGSDERRATLRPPAGRELVDDLRDRLIPDAEAAGEEELAAVLALLDDRLRRWARHPEWALGRAETAQALLDVIAVAGAPAEEETGEPEPAASAPDAERAEAPAALARS